MFDMNLNYTVLFIFIWFFSLYTTVRMHFLTILKELDPENYHYVWHL